MRRTAWMPVAMVVYLLFLGGAGAQARPHAVVRPRASPRSRVVARSSGAWAKPFRHASRALRATDSTYDSALKAAVVPTQTDQCDWGDRFTGDAVVEDPIVRFPGIHVGTDTRKCGVEKLENDAYEMYAQTHGLAPGDPRIELDGQYEIAGNLWALLNQVVAAHKDNPSGLDADDQGAYDWLQSKVLDPLRAAAQDAKNEYDKWARAPCGYSPPDTTLFSFTPLVDPACGVTLASLLRGPSPPSFEEFLEYGTYDANKTVSVGLQLAQYNAIARQRLGEGMGLISSFLLGGVVHVINLASEGKLLKLWKKKIYSASSSSKADEINRQRDIRARNRQRRAQFKQEEVEQEVKDVQREEKLLQEGVKADEVISDTVDKTIEQTTKAGTNISRAASTLGAEAIDGPAIIVGLAIDVLVSEITHLQTELAIPDQLRGNLDAVNKQSLEDLLLGSQSDGGYQTALSYFQGQLDLPAPKIGTPAESRASKPSAQVTTRPFDGTRWQVTNSAEGGAPLDTFYPSVVSLVTWPLGVDRGVNGLNQPQFAIFHGQVWHIPNRDANIDDDTAAGLGGWLPSGELRYFDWEGNPRIAMVDGDHFIDTPSPGSNDMGGQDQSDLCAEGDAECDSTKVLFALSSAGGVNSSPTTFAYDDNGNRGVEQDGQRSDGTLKGPFHKIRLTIKPDTGAAAVQNINNQWGKGATTYDHPTSNDGGLFAGSTVTLLAPEANPLGYPETYTWTVESRCTYQASCTPSKDAAFHGNPAVTLTGQSVAYAWPAPGTYHVRLTTSDQYGATQVSDQDVTVLGHDPTFALGSSTGFAGASVFGPVHNGSPQTITGCIDDPAGPYMNPTVTVDWGDGSTETQSGQSSTSSTLSFHYGTTASCPRPWQFAATHTYNLANPNNANQIQKPLHIAVDDGLGYSAAKDMAVNVDLTSAPKFTSADSTSFPANATNNFVVRTSGTPTPTLSCTAPCTLPPGIQFQPRADGTALLGGATGRANQGSYPISIHASNSQGTASQSFTLTVTAPPDITSADTRTVLVNQSSTVNLSATGTPSPGMFVGGTLPHGMVAVDSSSGGTASITGTPTATGSYPLTVTASSSSGTDTQPFTLIVGTVPAFTSPNSAGFVQNASPSTFTITTSGFPSAAISCDSPCTLPSGLSFHDNGDGTAQIYGSASTAGSNQVTLTATSSAGSVQQTLTVTSSATAGPNITFPSGATYDSSAGLWNASMQVGSPATVQISASPPSALTESGALPDGMSFTDNGDGTATISGTPAAGSGGAYGLTIKAHPGQGADGIAFLSLQVEGAPTMTSSSQAQFTAGQAGTFTINTSGLPRASISLADALPEGLHFTDNGDGTATISGTPSADAVGGHTVHVVMGNLITFPGSVTAPLDIEVGDAPAISSPATAGFGEGRAGSFTVQTHGYPAPVLQVVSGTLPPGIAFTDNGDGTATFSGTPTDTTDTSYALTVAASSWAGTTSQVLTIAIGPVPSIDAQDTASFTVGSSGTAPVNSPTTPAPSFSASGLPGGLSLADHGDGTTAIQGTPDAGTGGKYTVTVTATNTYGSTTKDVALSVAETPRFLGTQSGLTCAGGADPSVTSTSFLSRGSWTLCASGYPTPTLGYAGILPSGVTFRDNGDGSGTFSGSAAAGKGGPFPLTLLAINTAGQSETPLTLTIDQPVAQVPLVPVTFVAEQSNLYTLTAPGYPLPAFRLTPDRGCGAAPDWLKFKDNDDGTATLTGTPPASAMGKEFDFSLREEQGVGNGAFTCVAISVAPVAVVSATPPPSTVGSGYHYVFTSTDPSATYAAVPVDSTATSTLRSVSATSAAARRHARRVLPPGLHLSKHGVLSGRPTTVGTWIFRVVVTTRRGRAVSRAITIRGRSAAHQLEIRAFRVYGPGGAGDWFVAARNTTRVAMPLFGWRVAVFVPGQRRPVLVSLRPGRLSPEATVVVAGPSFTLRHRARFVVGPARSRIPSGFELIAPDGRVSDRAGEIGAPRTTIEGKGLPALRGRALSSQGAYVRHLKGRHLVDTGDNSRDFTHRRLNPARGQRIRFTSRVPHHARVGGTYRIRAAGGHSGRPVKFSLGSGSGRGVCTLTGNVVRFTGPGTCVVVATQRGSLLFSAAAPVRQVIRVRARGH